MHPSIELIPAENILSPSGVTHLIQGAAESTLCGRSPRRGWAGGEADVDGASVTCLTCWRTWAEAEQNARLGNYSATNKVDCCANCNGTDWAMDHCTECGEEWTSDARPEEE